MPLLQNQADGFRAIRKKLNEALIAVDDLTTETVDLCDHDAIFAGCAVCRVWQAINRANGYLTRASDQLDRALSKSDR